MAAHVRAPNGEATYDLVDIAAGTVPGARWASVTILRKDHFTTAASTGQEAVDADQLQYELGSGSCVDALLENAVFVTGDVSAEPRWRERGPRANAETGIVSVFSQRLHLHEQAGVFAGLNVYSDHHDAFDRTAVGAGLILATHGAAVVSEHLTAHRAANLSRALHSNREIGARTPTASLLTSPATSQTAAS